MGLHMQHAAAATLLAVVRRSRLVMASLLGELPRLLPVQLRREHITFQVPAEQKKKGIPTGVETAVMGMLSELGVVPQVKDGEQGWEDVDVALLVVERWSKRVSEGEMDVQHMRPPDIDEIDQMRHAHLKERPALSPLPDSYPTALTAPY